MSDDVRDDWENLLDSGELDEKLNDIKIESTTEVGGNLGEPNFSGPVRILTNDSRILLSRKQQEPTMKILKRPEANVSKSTDQQVPKAAPKSLSQREAEYAEARQRILGAEAAAINSIQGTGEASKPAAPSSNKSSNTKSSGGGKQTQTMTAGSKQNQPTTGGSKQNQPVTSGSKQTQPMTAGSKNSNSNKQTNSKNSSGSTNTNRKNNSQMHHLPHQQVPLPVTPIFQPPPSHHSGNSSNHHHSTNYMLPVNGVGAGHPTMYPPPQFPPGPGGGGHHPPGPGGHHQYPLINGPMMHGNVVSHFSQYPPPRGGPDAAAPFYKVRR